MKELINELRTTAKEIASYGHAGWGNVCTDAANALEQLTSGDVELPEPLYTVKHRAYEDSFSKDQLIDYGNRRAAQAVLTERERCDLHKNNKDVLVFSRTDMNDFLNDSGIKGVEAAHLAIRYQKAKAKKESKHDNN